MNGDELNGENVQNRLILNLKISQFLTLFPVFSPTRACIGCPFFSTACFRSKSFLIDHNYVPEQLELSSVLFPLVSNAYEHS